MAWRGAEESSQAAAWPQSGDGAARFSVASPAAPAIVPYDRLAVFYDLTFGAILQAGRRRAVERMALRAGLRVLEIGVGTGITLPLYPSACEVIGIDRSAPMLDRARRRVRAHGMKHVQLMDMDAADLRFPDDTFDIVYAPYVMSVVADPIRVAAEMRRVGRPGGRMVILNHFRSTSPMLSRLERMISPLTRRAGFTADLDLPGFLADAGLTALTIDRVNVPAIWSLVTCQVEKQPAPVS